MGDFPAQSGAVSQLFVHTGCIPECTQDQMWIATGVSSIAPVVRTWVANLVTYAPIFIANPYPVKRVFWMNGSTVTSTNADFGIYTADGVRIYNTGATAMSGTSAVQYVTPSEFTLDAGLYYFAWSCNGTSNRGMAYGGTAVGGRTIGLLEETTVSFGLPATMTPVAHARSWGAYVCGVTRTSSGF